MTTIVWLSYAAWELDTITISDVSYRNDRFKYDTIVVGAAPTGSQVNRTCCRTLIKGGNLIWMRLARGIDIFPNVTLGLL